MLQAELSRKTIQSWRNFTSSEEFRNGVEFLRYHHAPKIGRANDAEMLRAAAAWTSYHEALNDLMEVLCSFPVKEQSAESAGLVSTSDDKETE